MKKLKDYFLLLLIFHEVLIQKLDYFLYIFVLFIL